MSNKVLMKWERPKEAGIKASKALLETGLEAAPRVLTITGIILLLFYLFAAYYLEKFIPGYTKQAIRILITLGLFCLGLVAYAFFAPVLAARFKCTYAITEKGISKRTILDAWFVSWKTIKGYAIIKNDGDNIIALKANIKRSLSYPIELEEELDQLLGSKLNKLEPETFSRKVPMLNIKGWQWLFVLGVIIIWAVVVGYWAWPVMKWLHQGWHEWVKLILVIACFFVGPATVAFFLLFGRRIFKPKEGMLPLLPFLNMFSWMLTIFSGVIWEVERMLRESGQ
jgi:hypothetical protein